MTDVELICEGPCNPNLWAYDEMVARAIRQRMSDGGGGGEESEPLTNYGVPEWHTVNAVYTPHVPTTSGRWQCTECGASRKWGDA